MARAFTVSLALLALAGCNEPASKRLNAPPHGYPAGETAAMQGTFTYMVDNAMLADMTMTDSHFYPHRRMLNALGEERLARFASLLDAYGGELRYSTDLEDKGLIGARLQTIRDFLGEAGIPLSSQTVIEDMAGGEGMYASEAILIRVKEGTYSGNEGARSGADGNDSGFSNGSDQ